MNELLGKHSPIAWMAHHPVAPNLIMIVFLVGGFLVWGNMQREVFPDTQEDLIQVSVTYPGASPEEVEQGIVLAVEEAVRGLDGVKELRASATEGVAQITIEALSGANLERLGQEVKSEVDRIRTFPEEAEKPDISVVSRKHQVLQLLLFGNVSDWVLREKAEQLRDLLLQDPDITQVELSGDKSFEISIEVEQHKLRQYNLSIQDIVAKVSSAAIEMPGGSVKPQGGEVLVRVTERRDYGSEFARIPIISTPDGGDVSLEDIATIKDDFEEVDRFSYFDGQPAIGVFVYRVGKQSPTDVSKAVDKVCASFVASLPDGLHMKKQNDMADEYQGRINLLLKNGTIGILLVLGVLGLFLEVKLAFWVMMGIPVSFLGAIMFLPFLGVTLNMMSLFAFIVALGIVVDDAIVVGENVYYHHESGKSFMQAAIDGSHELIMPVTFSVLTNVVTFMPLIFIPGMMGKMFWMLPVVVICAFLISLFEVFFILPSHLGHRKDKERSGIARWLHQPQQFFSKNFTKAIHVLFRPMMNVFLQYRYLVLVVAICILMVVVSWPASGRMGFSMMATIESDYGRADLELPYGSAVEKTIAIVQRIEQGALEVVEECGRPELLDGINVLVGGSGSHTASLTVFLADAKTREGIMTTEEFVRRWRDKVGPIHGIKALSYSADFGGPGAGDDITIELSHQSMDVLEQVSSELAQKLASYPMIKDINDGFQPGKDQINFKISPEGESLGLSAQEVARQMRNAFYGAEVLRQQRGRNEVKVMVRLPKHERISEYNIEQLMLRTPSGSEVPLMEVVTIERSNAYTNISRREGRRVIQVTAGVEPRSRAQEIISTLRETELPEIASRYPGLSYSFEGREAEIRDSMGGLKAGFVIALMVIYALLAIPFRSYFQPLIVMVSIPFGAVGAILGHLIMGFGLSLDSIFGLLALSGVVINGSLVLVNAINCSIANGVNVHDASLNAVEQRFRPVLLTTLTTFCGVAPLIFETSIQAQIMIPMAISLGFGVLFSTFITLLLVPCLYLIMDDINRFFVAFGKFIRGDYDISETKFVD